MSAARDQTPESLTRYEEMRDFTRTSEPPPSAEARGGPLTFTIRQPLALCALTARAV